MALQGFTNVSRRSYKPAEFKHFVTDTAKTTAIFVGDAVYYDEAANVVRSAADFPWQGSELATLRAFARVFAGIAMDPSPITNIYIKSDSGPIRVCRAASFRIPIPSTTVEMDSLFSLKQADTARPTTSTDQGNPTQGTWANSGTNYLDPQSWQVQTDRIAALGRALEDSTSDGVLDQTALTSVLVAIESRYEEAWASDDVLILDPGNAKAIQVSKYADAICEIASTAANETRTVAAPEYAGQSLQLVGEDVTTNGAVKITFSAAIDQAGTVDVFLINDGDVLDFVAVNKKGTPAWRLLAKQGGSGETIGLTAKTAAYTLTAADLGKAFSNEGAAAEVDFKLPTCSEEFVGKSVDFYGLVAQTLGILPNVAGDIISDGSTTVASLKYSTAGHQIGAHARATGIIFGGNPKWFVSNLSACALTVA